MDPKSMTNILIGASRIKFSVLDELFEKVTLPPGKVNLIIDGYAMWRRLYQPEFAADIDRNDTDVFVQEFVSSSLNTIAHYRRYLVTRMHRNNRIFIVWNRSCPDYQISLLDTYGESYFDKFFPDDHVFGALNKAMRKSIEFLKEMVQYFEGVYYLDTDGIDDHVAVKIIKDEYPKDGFILYTKNELWLQHCDHKTVVIRPNRDDSKFITEDTISKFLFRKQKYDGENIDADNIRHLFALSGASVRDIEPVSGYRLVSISKAIDKMVKKDVYLPDMNIRNFIETLNGFVKRPYTESEMEDAEKNFKCIDAKLSLAAVPKGRIKKVLQSRIDLYDAVGLQELNDTFEDAEDVINISDLNLTDALSTYRDERAQLNEDLNVFWQEG